MSMSNVSPDNPIFNKETKISSDKEKETKQEGDFQGLFSKSHHKDTPKSNQTITTRHSFENLSMEEIENKIAQSEKGIKSIDETIARQNLDLLFNAIRNQKDNKPLFISFSPESGPSELGSMHEEELTNLLNLTVLIKVDQKLEFKYLGKAPPQAFIAQVNQLTNNQGVPYNVTINKMTKDEFEAFKLQIFLQFGIRIKLKDEAAEESESHIHKPKADVQNAAQHQKKDVEEKRLNKKNTSSKDTVAVVLNGLSKTAISNKIKAARRTKEHYEEIRDQETKERRDRVLDKIIKTQDRKFDLGRSQIKKERI